MINFEQKTSPEIAADVAARVRARRKELKLTQTQLASKAGMTLASYKRFEQKGLIAFQSLIAIAIALDCESDFDELFVKRAYSSIEEVITLAEKRQG
jgi:transcriptional regulator with XRE-family HTH domain